MRLFASREPWTPADWWDAGKKDALNCVQARYGGSDISEEDSLRQYIYGYMNGLEINKRTADCPRYEPSVGFTGEETSYYEPGLLDERWKTVVLIIYFALACFGFWVVVHGLARVFGG